VAEIREERERERKKERKRERAYIYILCKEISDEITTQGNHVFFYLTPGFAGKENTISGALLRILLFQPSKQL